jgi:hypothetical protein
MPEDMNLISPVGRFVPLELGSDLQFRASSDIRNSWILEKQERADIMAGVDVNVVIVGRVESCTSDRAVNSFAALKFAWCD